MILLEPGTGAPRGLDPIPRLLLGVGVSRDVGHDGGAVCTCFEHVPDARERYPADPNEGYLADFLLPLREARKTLRRKGHGFQDRRIDGAERDIIWVCFESPRELGLVMRRDTKPHTRAADRRKIRRREIALAEMDEIATGVDCLLPMIIDDELGAMPRAERFCLYYFLADGLV